MMGCQGAGNKVEDLLGFHRQPPPAVTQVEWNRSESNYWLSANLYLVAVTQHLAIVLWASAAFKAFAGSFS